MIKLETVLGKVNILNPEGWILIDYGVNNSVHLVNTQAEYTTRDDSEFHHVVYAPNGLDVEKKKSFTLQSFVAHAKEQGLHFVKVYDDFYVRKEDILSVSNIVHFEDGLYNNHTVVVHKYKGNYLVEDTPIEEFMKQLED